MDFKDLTPEQQEKARACKSAEELAELAKAEGVELSEEQLEAMAAGGNWLCSEECLKYCPFWMGDCTYFCSTMD